MKTYIPYNLAVTLVEKLSHIYKELSIGISTELFLLMAENVKQTKYTSKRRERMETNLDMFIQENDTQ